MKFKRFLQLCLLALLGLLLGGCNVKEPKSPLLKKSYTGQVFDGTAGSIGEVELAKHVDGDTIHVTSSGKSYKIRFLGIDTPESTGKVEAWGKKASDYTKNALKDAKIIVESRGIDATGSRVLGWVWYIPKGETVPRLLNFDIVLNGFSKAKLGGDADEFSKELLQADKYARSKKLHLYSPNPDPDFNYATTTIKGSIKYILDNGSDWQTGTIFEIEGLITRKKGTGVFVEDIEDEFTYEENGEQKVHKGKAGAFFYGHFNDERFYTSTSVGDKVKVKAKLDYEGEFGTQFTDVTEATVTGRINMKDFEFPVITSSDDFIEYAGRVVKFKGVLVSKIIRKKPENSDNYYWIIECKDKDGNGFNMYIGADIKTKWDQYLIETQDYEILAGGETLHWSDFRIEEGVKYDIVAAIVKQPREGYQLTPGECFRVKQTQKYDNDGKPIGDPVKEVLKDDLNLINNFKRVK